MGAKYLAATMSVNPNDACDIKKALSEIAPLLLALLVCLFGASRVVTAAVEPFPSRCIAFSPYVGNLDPNSTDPAKHPTPALIDSLLDALVQRTPFRCILTYGVLHGLSYVFDAASRRNLKVIAILWLDSDTTVNQNSVALGIQAAKAYPDTILRLSCGSEVRTRHGRNLDNEIRNCIAQLRAAGVTQPIASIDTWWEWCNASFPCQLSDLASDVDWIGINIFPWWENKFSGMFPCTTVAAAADFHVARLLDVKARYPSKEVVITEFGWPAGPEGFRETNQSQQFAGQQCIGAEAGEANQRQVVLQTLTKLDFHGLRGVAFEGVRQGAWKIATEGAVGPLWGICLSSAPYSCKSLLRADADFDGDLKTDIAVYREGFWIHKPSNGGANMATPFGGGADIPVPGDYDGDGKTDVAVYRDGNWIYRPSSGGPDVAIPFGGGNDIPMPGDYDGDGKTDVAVYRRIAFAASWVYKPSSGGADVFVPLGFSDPADIPATGDFNGDGKTDRSFYRKFNSSGGVSSWYAIGAANGGRNLEATFALGLAFTTPVPGDYDGDGTTEFAVYRPSDGLWFYRPSSGSSGIPVALQFGGGTDVPVPADYDGDGKTDIAVYRNGLWIYRPSSGGVDVAIQFGGGSDVPLN